MDTDFTVESIIVAEDVGVLTDTLCVKGGPNKRSFGLFSTRGSAERCSGGPCPAAIGTQAHLCTCTILIATAFAHIHL